MERPRPDGGVSFIPPPRLGLALLTPSFIEQIGLRPCCVRVSGPVSETGIGSLARCLQACNSDSSRERRTSGNSGFGVNLPDLVLMFQGIGQTSETVLLVFSKYLGVLTETLFKCVNGLKI